MPRKAHKAHDAVIRRVLALNPADRLQIAVSLIKNARYADAEALVRSVADELTTLRLLESVGTRE